VFRSDPLKSLSRVSPDLSTEYAAMCGALWLNASTAASRLRDPWKARDILREHAEPLSRRVPDGANTMWTVFGPTNVALHAVSIEVEAGETAEALRIAEQIDVSGSPSMERRTTFYLQLAACYDQRRDDMGVLVHLQGARRDRSGRPPVQCRLPRARAWPAQEVAVINGPAGAPSRRRHRNARSGGVGPRTAGQPALSARVPPPGTP